MRKVLYSRVCWAGLDISIYTERRVGGKWKRGFDAMLKFRPALEKVWSYDSERTKT